MCTYHLRAQNLADGRTATATGTLGGSEELGVGSSQLSAAHHIPDTPACCARPGLQQHLLWGTEPEGSTRL